MFHMTDERLEIGQMFDKYNTEGHTSKNAKGKHLRGIRLICIYLHNP